MRLMNLRKSLWCHTCSSCLKLNSFWKRKILYYQIISFGWQWRLLSRKWQPCNVFSPCAFFLQVEEYRIQVMQLQLRKQEYEDEIQQLRETIKKQRTTPAPVEVRPFCWFKPFCNALQLLQAQLFIEFWKFAYFVTCTYEYFVIT